VPHPSSIEDGPRGSGEERGKAMILIALLALCVLALGCIALLWRRNDAVAAYRHALIDEMYRLNMGDIDAVYQAKCSGDKDARYSDDWRRKEFHTVSYDAMVWQPWRPLTSYYREGFPAVRLEPASN
jgi:hypothetical protein